MVALALSTGMFAVMGNVIGFSLIGRAGPVTFQVVGHVKTILIFIFGLLMFPEKEESSSQFTKKISGLVVSMAGVVLYTIFEVRAKEQEKKIPEDHVPLR
jgi:solute carrier family 35 protein E3